MNPLSNNPNMGDTNIGKGSRPIELPPGYGLSANRNLYKDCKVIKPDGTPKILRISIQIEHGSITSTIKKINAIANDTIQIALREGVGTDSGKKLIIAKNFTEISTHSNNDSSKVDLSKYKAEIGRIKRALENLGEGEKVRRQPSNTPNNSFGIRPFLNNPKIYTDQSAIVTSNSTPDAISNYFDEIRHQENLNPTRQRELSQPDMHQASLRKMPSFLFPPIKEEVNEKGKIKYSLDYSSTNKPDKSEIAHYQRAIESKNFIALWKFLNDKNHLGLLDKIDPHFKKDLNLILLKFDKNEDEKIKKMHLEAKSGSIDDSCKHILTALKEVPFNPEDEVNGSEQIDSRRNSSSSKDSLNGRESSISTKDKAANSGYSSGEDVF